MQFLVKSGSGNEVSFEIDVRLPGDSGAWSRSQKKKGIGAIDAIDRQKRQHRYVNLSLVRRLCRSGDRPFLPRNEISSTSVFGILF